MKALILTLAILAGGLVSAPGMASSLPPPCDPWFGTHPIPTPTPPPPTGRDDFTTLPRETPPPVPNEVPEDTQAAYGPCPETTPTPTPTPVPSETPTVVETPEPSDDPNQVIDPGMPVLEGSGCQLSDPGAHSMDLGVLFLALGLGLGLRRQRA